MRAPVGVSNGKFLSLPGFPLHQREADILRDQHRVDPRGSQNSTCLIRVEWALPRPGPADRRQPPQRRESPSDFCPRTAAIGISTRPTPPGLDTSAPSPASPRSSPSSPGIPPRPCNNKPAVVGEQHTSAALDQLVPAGLLLGNHPSSPRRRARAQAAVGSVIGLWQERALGWHPSPDARAARGVQRTFCPTSTSSAASGPRGPGTLHLLAGRHPSRSAGCPGTALPAASPWPPIGRPATASGIRASPPR